MTSRASAARSQRRHDVLDLRYQALGHALRPVAFGWGRLRRRGAALGLPGRPRRTRVVRLQACAGKGSLGHPAQGAGLPPHPLRAQPRRRHLRRTSRCHHREHQHALARLLQHAHRAPPRTRRLHGVGKVARRPGRARRRSLLREAHRSPLRRRRNRASGARGARHPRGRPHPRGRRRERRAPLPSRQLPRSPDQALRPDGRPLRRSQPPRDRRGAREGNRRGHHGRPT